MKVTDMNGFTLEVTNLDEAIRQSEAFVAYSQVGGDCSEFNEKQKDYWSDLYHKLLITKSKETMSNLSNKTEYKTLPILGTIVKMFDWLHCFDMTKGDDMDATASKNLLHGIIESNNYTVTKWNFIYRRT